MPTISEHNSIPWPSVFRYDFQIKNNSDLSSSSEFAIIINGKKYTIDELEDSLQLLDRELISNKFLNKLLDFFFVNAAKKIGEQNIELIPEATEYLKTNYPFYEQREIVMMYVLQKFLEL